VILGGFRKKPIWLIFLWFFDEPASIFYLRVWLFLASAYCSVFPRVWSTVRELFFRESTSPSQRAFILEVALDLLIVLREPIGTSNYFSSLFETTQFPVFF